MQKLVRDRIPEVIKADGEKPVIRVLKKDDFSVELNKKLNEEISELLAAASREEQIEELADVYEVLSAYADLHDITQNEIVSLQDKKREKKGGFSKRIFLEVIE